VKTLLAWHRASQLPRYHDLLEGIARDIEHPVSAARVRQRYDEMAGLWEAFVNRLAPEAAPLLRSLSPQQVRELFGNIEEENRSLWKEYGGRTPQERAERRARNAVRAIQRVTGTITDAQRAQVEAATTSMYDAAPQWLEHRRSWQAGFRSLLEGAAQGPAFESGLRELLLNPNRFDRPEYRERVEQNQEIVMRMLADLSVTLTPKQRQKFAGKMHEYSDIVEDISRQQQAAAQPAGGP
jgi:5'-deoxynucleotidase YfbR-like HD superfamily hydrolase